MYAPSVGLVYLDLNTKFKLPYHLVHIALNCIVVTGVNLIKVDRVVDVGPHAVIMLHMAVKPLHSG